MIINQLILSYNLFYNLLLHFSYKLPIFVPLSNYNNMEDILYRDNHTYKANMFVCDKCFYNFQLELENAGVSYTETDGIVFITGNRKKAYGIYLDIEC